MRGVHPTPGRPAGRWRPAGLAAAAAAVLALASLVPARAAAASDLVVGAPADVVSLDPAVLTDGVSLAATQQVFETLVRFRGASLDLEPGLAAGWETSADGLVWTFHLRPGVRFHDGTALDAAAVVWNFDRWRRAGHPHHRDQTRAGRTFEYWESQFGGFDDASIVAAVEAVGPLAVRLVLRRPQAPLLANLAIPAFGIASPPAVARHGPEFGKHPVGTGPFRFVEWRAGEAVVLEANPGSWGPSPRVRRVVIRPIRDAAQRLAALRAGEIHLAEGLGPAEVAVAGGDPGLQVVFRPPNATAYLAFNHRLRELRDRRVRLAFAHAVDKRALVEALYGSAGVVATQAQPPTLWGHDPGLRDRPHDPGRARALLREAGFPAGLDRVTGEDGRPEPLVLWYPPVSRPYLPAPREVAEALAADLARAGIAARPETVDWATYLDRVRTGRLPLYLLGWIGDNGDPDNCLCYMFCTPGAPHQGFYANPPLAQLLLRGQALQGRSERAVLYRRAEAMLHEDAARLFLAHARMPVALSRRVRGYEPHPTGVESFAAVEVLPGPGR
jgi:peptide/nickel transport system substrate-binding protein